MILRRVQDFFRIRLQGAPDRGSEALEAAIGVPAFLLFIAMIIAGGRLAIADQSVQAAAAEAARSASIARTQGQAHGSAVSGATSSLANQKLQCASKSVSVDTSGFASPVGTPCQRHRHRHLRRQPVRRRRAGTARHTDHHRDHDQSPRYLPGAMMAAQRLQPEAPERGSVSVWLATASIVMIILVGVVVDLAGQVHAQQHTRNIANQAARVAGQQINAPAAIRGIGVQANAAQAVAAAQTYLNASDVTGTASIVNGNTIRVSTSSTYNTKFLSIIGLGSMRVTGQAEARIVRVVDGVSQ
jgi:Flp pilus assembly protein TadG